MEVQEIKGSGGEGGIRTLDTGFSPYNGLANRRLQPLGHLSSRTCGVTIVAVWGVLWGSWLKHLQDRKSTRLNSSHTVISYAVFCLKKKKKKDRTHVQLQSRIRSQS